VLVAAVLAVLALVVVAGLATGPGLTPGPGPAWGGWYGTLQSAGLLFFAFAGYARIATLGEEVRDPARVIPRAIVTALTVAVVVYAAVAVALLSTLGPDRLAASAAPLADAAAAWPWAAPVVRVGAAAASLAALLALLAGVARTALAMARHHDLPAPLAAVHPRFAVPHRAEVALAALVGVGVLAFDLRGAIGFSATGVLLYYLVANLSALTQPAAQRRFPRALAVVGAIGCVALVATLPPTSVLIGLGVVAAGLAGRAVARRFSR
jgi:APA family basic amino acid/polyamine antiporter